MSGACRFLNARNAQYVEIFLSSASVLNKTNVALGVYLQLTVRWYILIPHPDMYNVITKGQREGVLESLFRHTLARNCLSFSREFVTSS